jgi:type VI secretion system VgrG family protein
MITLDFVSNADSKAVPHDTFQVLRFEGEEEISSLFRFEITLVSRDPEIDYKIIMDATASLSVTTPQRTRHIHGMLAHFTQQEEWATGLYIYKAVLVPRLWMMSRSQQNQIYQDITLIEIIKLELGVNKNKGNHKLIKQALLKPEDYEISVSITKKYDYVVQYKETDLNFISRLMEHEGIYYFFEHDEEREKLIITNSLSPLENKAQEITYQPDVEKIRYDSSVIYKLGSESKQVTSKILVKDYNYRTPHLEIQGAGFTDVDGIGFVSEYGSHAKDNLEAEGYADIRTEEALCEKTIYLGESNDAGFACGKEYTLFQHFRDAFNKTHMLTKVTHFAKQEIESWDTVGGTEYHNEFTSIPADVQYRPKRKTPKPVMHGIMNGKIESEMGNIGRADIDGWGRYKVSMPFDISDTASGKASRRIRMAQPYGGQGAGMSFPLAPGTEVIWTCIDGDIDRPIITGTVPNPLNPNPTTTDNYTQNIIKTLSGTTMGFLDGLFGTSGGAKFLEGGSNNDTQDSEEADESGEEGSNNDTQDSEEADESKIDADGSGSFFVEVPFNPDKKSLLRMGEACDVSLSKSCEKETDTFASGILSFTDGERTTITMRDDNHWHYGVSSDYYKAMQFSCFNDNKLEFYLGTAFDYKAGLFAEVEAGFKSSIALGIQTEMNLAAKATVGMEWTYSSTTGSNVDLAGDHRIEANDEIKIRTDPEDRTTDWIMEKVAPKVAAIAALAVTATGVAASIDEGSLDTDNLIAQSTAGATVGLGAILAVMATKHYISVIRKQEEDPGASFLDMSPKEIKMGLLGVSKRATVGKATYEPEDDKVISITADNLPLPTAASKTKNLPVGITIKKSGKATRKDNITLQVGKSTLTITEDSISLSVKEKADSEPKDTTSLILRFNDLNISAKKTTLKDIEASGDFQFNGATTEFQGPVTFTGNPVTVNGSLVVKGGIKNADFKSMGEGIKENAKYKDQIKALDEKVEKNVLKNIEARVELSKKLNVNAESIAENRKNLNLNADGIKKNRTDYEDLIFARKK